MGTWSAPDTPAKKKKLKKIRTRIENIKKALYPIFGDDELFDHLDNAIEKINEGVKAKWLPKEK